MAQPASGNHRRSGFNALFRPSQLISEPEQTPKHNTSRPSSRRGSSAHRSSGTGPRESLKVRNWRIRHTDGSKASQESETEKLSVESGSSDSLDLFSYALFPASKAHESKKQAVANDSCSTKASQSRESLAPLEEYDVLEAADVASTGTGSTWKGAHERVLDVVSTTRLAGSNKMQPLELFQLRYGSRNSFASLSKNQSRFLSPATTGDRSLEEELCYISARRHNAAMHENQGDQLMAALRASNSTPQKSRDSSSDSYVNVMDYCHPSLGSFAPSFDSPRTKERSRKLTSRDSGLSMSSEAHQMSEPRGSQACSEDSPTATPANLDSNQGDEKRRFEKFLQKLHRSRHTNERRRHADSGIESDAEPVAPKHDEREDGDATTHVEHRRPIQGSGRRVNTASDFSVEYWPGLRAGSRPRLAGIRSRDTEIADVCPGGQGKTLNPKAREFLSSTESLRLAVEAHGSSMGGLEFLQAKTVSPLPRDQPSGSQVSQEWLTRDDGGVLAQQTVPSLCPEVEAPHESTNTNETGMTRQLPELDPYLSLGLIPVTAPSRNGLAQGTGMPLPNDLLSSWKKQLGYTGNSPDTGSFPYAPLSGSTNFSGGAQTGAAASAAASQPRPVSKPKKPNPKDQQEYEAWVEWRKANEPGYAMACRLRQQRRAQRNDTQKIRVENGKRK